MTTIFHAASLTLFLALAVSAQNDPAPKPAPIASKTFVIEPGSHAIPALVDRVAAFLDCNILCNQSELESSGEIRITRRTEVDADGCWELFGSLLYYKGLAIVTLDQARGFHEVIAMSGPRGREITNGALFVKAENVEAYAKAKATPILTTVPLKHINATIATNALRPFYASTGAPSSGSTLTIGNLGYASEILLQGFGPQVAGACRLLQLVDAPADGPVDRVQVVRLQHADAADIVAVVEAAWAVPNSAHQALVQGMSEAIPSSRVLLHAALNALILRGSTASINEAMELIAKLDAPAVAPGPKTTDLLRRIEQLEARLAATESQKAPK